MPSTWPLALIPRRGTLGLVSRHSIFSSMVINERMLSIRCSIGRSAFWNGYCVCDDACGISTTRHNKPQILADRLRIWDQTFDDFDVFAEGRISQFVYAATGPLDFNAVDFSGLADAEDFAWIVGREITPARCFEAPVFHAARFPGDDCTDGAGITPGR